MPARVARIPNLECEAFYYDMERRGIVLLDMEPNAVADALEQGDIDAGPVSLLDIDQLTARAHLITGFCVASVNRAVSSVLLSTEPIADLGGAPSPSTSPTRLHCNYCGFYSRRSTVSVTRQLLTVQPTTTRYCLPAIERCGDAGRSVGLRIAMIWERNGRPGPACRSFSAAGWPGQTWSGRIS